MFNLLKYYRESKKIIGANANVFVFKRLNDEKSREYSDNKLLGKKILDKAGLPINRIYKIIYNKNDLKNFDWTALPNSFVLKPNRGSGGNGITVIFSKKYNKWISFHKEKLSEYDLYKKVSNILDGKYSLYNVPDIAFFEERVKVHPSLKLFSYRGISDIRIIVYNKIPLMAMLRLPTGKSEGKANLAQGGIACGIDLSSGKTTRAYIKSYGFIDYYYGKKKVSLRAIQIPYWPQILELAVKASVASGLNYAGIDITIDKDRGPVILELNAMPGLEIQNVNLAGLYERVRRVENLKVKNISKAIQIAVNLFGGDIEEELELISGQSVLGFEEKVQLFNKEIDEYLEVLAHIDTSRNRTVIDASLLKSLAYDKDLDLFENLVKKYKNIDNFEYPKIARNLSKELDMYNTNLVFIKAIKSRNSLYVLRPYLKMKFSISNKILDTIVGVKHRRQLKHKVLLGRSDLKNFLINPNKK